MPADRGSGCGRCDFIGFHEGSLCREPGSAGWLQFDKPVNMYLESLSAWPLYEICIAKPGLENRAF